MNLSAGKHKDHRGVMENIPSPVLFIPTPLNIAFHLVLLSKRLRYHMKIIILIISV